MKTLDILTAATAGIWYSLPDFIASRKTRSWVKTGLMIPVIAAGAREAQNIAGKISADITEQREGSEPQELLDAGIAEPQSRANQFGFIALAVGVVAGLVGFAIAGEKALHKLGQYLRRRGLRYGHSLVGVGAAIATLLSGIALDRDDNED